MEMSNEELLARIKALETENTQLKQKVAQESNVSLPNDPHESGLSLQEYLRYGRQMIVPQFGSLPSQLKLKNSSILVVGAGGLGCPALLYLSAAGIGHIGIIDHDTVEISNLHRQVLHTSDNVGMFKCESAKKYISKLNPHVKVTTYPTRLTTSNAFDIISQYDLVLDCTDAPAIRYLINDVSVLCGKTIVSGSGLKTDGQLSILNFDNSGPCYRCFYPQPPSADSVTSCSDGGVIGPAIGLVGITMALETIKLLTGFYTRDNFKPFLSIYSGYPQQQIRVFKMRNRQPTCAVCGSAPIITKESIESDKIDYVAFCGKASPPTLDANFRINVKQYSNEDTNSILIDVRPKEQFQITSLPNSINIPWDPTMKKLDDVDDYLPAGFDKKNHPVYVVCRYGNDSQLATKKLIETMGFGNVKDIVGGLNKWSDDIDPSFPKY
jgi:adenylyltransferase/sulfurtransferase